MKMTSRILALSSGLWMTCLTASANLHAVPEPGSLSLVGLAIGALVYIGTRKKK